MNPPTKQPSAPVAGHTPTPWHITRKHADPDTAANLIEIFPEIGGCHGDWSTQEICNLFMAEKGSIQEANAALIVEAVNNHAAHLARIAELEGALKKCHTAFGLILLPLDNEERSQPVYRTCFRAREHARSALAQSSSPKGANNP